MPPMWKEIQGGKISQQAHEKGSMPNVPEDKLSLQIQHRRSSNVI